MDANNPPNKRYLYRANALGFGGQLTKPTPEILPVQATAVLPITGGHGEHRVEKFRHGNIVSFDSAHSHVSGSLGEKKATPTFNTAASSVLENFNLLGMISAERIVAHLSSRHPVKDGEVSIIPVGSHFVNLRVAGSLITMETNVDVFCKLDTYKAIEDEYKLNGEFAEMARREFHWGGGGDDAPAHIADWFGWMKGVAPSELPQSKGYLVGSIFKNIKSEDPAVKVHGYVLDVPQFGKVYLGEYIISRPTRRLTMVRADIGCPYEGEMVAAELEGNGTTFP